MRLSSRQAASRCGLQCSLVCFSSPCLQSRWFHHLKPASVTWMRWIFLLRIELEHHDKISIPSEWDHPTAVVTLEMLAISAIVWKWTNEFRTENLDWIKSSDRYVHNECLQKIKFFRVSARQRQTYIWPPGAKSPLQSVFQTFFENNNKFAVDFIDKYLFFKI